MKGVKEEFSKAKVKACISYVKRNKHVQQKKAKVFSEDYLRSVIDELQSDDDILAIRNKALLLICYFGALRGSELLNLHINDIYSYEDNGGIGLRIRSSKTNQYGKEDLRYIPVSPNKNYCPVTSIKKLLQALPKTESSPLFRSTTNSNTFKATSLSKSRFYKICKELLGEEYSTHSMRISHVTNGKINGASDSELMQQTKHKSPQMIREYTQFHDIRMHNSANRLLL